MNSVSEKTSYGLDTLVLHLARGGQHERIRTLFANDQWMQRRVAAEEYSYEGFVDDIELTLNTLVAFDAPYSTHAARDAARLSSIRSSIQSLTAIPVRVLIGICRNNIWPITRVISHLRRIAPPSSRILAFAAILDTIGLSDADRSHLTSSAIEHVSRNAEQIPLRCITRLVRAIKDEALASPLSSIVNRKVDASTPFDGVTRELMGEVAIEQPGETIDDVLEALPLLRTESQERNVTRLVQILVEACTRKADTPVKDPSYGERSSKRFMRELEDRVPELASNVRKEKAPESTKLMSLMQEAFLRHGPFTDEHRIRQLQFLEYFVARHRDRQSLVAQICTILTTARDADLFCGVSRAYAKHLHSKSVASVVGKLASQEGDFSTRCLSQFLKDIGEDGIETLSASTDGTVNRLLAKHRAEETETQPASHADTFSATMAKIAAFTHFANRTDFFSPITREESDFAAPTQSDDDLAFAISSVEEVQNQWLHQVLSDRTVAEGADNAAENGREKTNTPEATPAGDAQPSTVDPVASHLMAVGAPMFLSIVVSTQLDSYPEEFVDALIEKWLDEHVHPTEYPFQLYLLTTTPFQREEDRTNDKLCRAVHRIQGFFLRKIIDRAYNSGGSIRNAWAGLPRKSIVEADFQPVIEYALSLPYVRQRNQFGFAMHGDMNAVRPRLEAIFLIAQHLQDKHFERVFESVMALTDEEALWEGLDILGPYLRTHHAEAVVARRRKFMDGLKEIRLVHHGQPDIDTFEMLQPMFSNISAGRDLATALLSTLRIKDGEDWSRLEALCLDTLKKRDANVRLDCLSLLVAAWPKDIERPRELIAFALELPVSDSTGHFSWRAHMASRLIAHFKGDVADTVWKECQELPKRLNIGDSEAFGWHWSYEYPYACVLGSVIEYTQPDRLYELFDKSKDLFWTSREEIFEKLAAQADEALAAAMFDVVLEKLARYHQPGVTMKELSAEEGAFAICEMGLFVNQREKASCDIIAALAPKLDDRRFVQAVELCLELKNPGPLSWLPAQLIPLGRQIEGELYRRVLSSAAMFSMFYMTIDPTRFDVLISLLPYIRLEAATSLAPVQKIVDKYFPGKDFLLLDQKEFSQLTKADQKEYVRLTTMADQFHNVHPDFVVEDVMTPDGFKALGEERSLEVFRTLFLGPVMAAQIEEIIRFSIAASPVGKRVRALRHMQGNLRDREFSAIVASSFDEACKLVEAADEDGLEAMHCCIEYLYPSDFDKYIDVLRNADGITSADENGLESFLRGGIRQFAREIEVPGKHNWLGDMAEMIGMKMSHDAHQDALEALMGKRGRALAAIVERLDESQLSKLVQVACELPANEKFGLMVVLIPKCDVNNRIKLYRNVMSCESPALRMMLPWFTKEHLPDECDPDVALNMLDAARMLSHWESKVIALSALLGFFDSDMRESLLRECLEVVDSESDKDRTIGALRILVRMSGDSTELRKACLRRALAFDDITSRVEGVRACVHEDSVKQLAESEIILLKATACSVLVESSRYGRELFLQCAHALAPVFGLDSDDAFLRHLIRSVFEVSHEWEWV